MNAAYCKNCYTILISKHRHDWVSCDCFRNEFDNEGVYIDGGNAYRRCGGKLENLVWLDKDDSGLAMSQKHKGYYDKRGLFYESTSNS